MHTIDRSVSETSDTDDLPSWEPMRPRTNRRFRRSTERN